MTSSGLTSRMSARPATLDDAAEVVRLAAVMYSSMGHDVSDPRWIETATSQFTSRLGDDLGVFVVDHPDRPGLAASAAATVATRLSAPNNLAGCVPRTSSGWRPIPMPARVATGAR